ncbi:RDD family protein [Serinicoccus chungangensis]|nr:RDD family protein [Serinicoccus chungangensis]
MSWSPPPSPDHGRADGPTDAPPWESAPPLPPYVPGARSLSGPEDVPTTPPPPPPRLRYADWGERVAATTIDAGLVFGLLMALALMSAVVDPLEDLAGAVWVGAVGYLGWLNGSTGQSPGKAVLGLKVLRDADGTCLGGVVGVLRTAVLGFLSIMTVFVFLVVNSLWPLRDRQHRAVHDLMFGAVVVSGYPKARPSLRLLRP